MECERNGKLIFDLIGQIGIYEAIQKKKSQSKYKRRSKIWRNSRKTRNE